MSRPRHDSNQLPATTRMENAFWSLLEERDYTKITVTDIVNIANVNRNSFYYHYCKLDNLAETAIRHTVEEINRVLPEFTVDPSKAWNGIMLQLIGVPANRVHLDHIALTVSKHSSPYLIFVVHDALRDGFISWQHLDRNISVNQNVLLEFSVGGLLAIAGIWPTLSKETTVEQWSNLDAAVVARTLYMSVSDESMPGFWVRLFRSALEKGEDSILRNIAQTERTDHNFKHEVDIFLRDLSRLQNMQPTAPEENTDLSAQ
ncbi:AcrR family transcriptional regulator [Bifidobacterium commune]|uniref:Transcriptional regulator, TetR family n=1 Tax=Bifidobacterium commune TaxID=1505727 RepID=A0A1C4H743_9BIFI|nr:TetR/AcrR family transcriptional regulator [Bifidobacterium commune]MBB2955581.1 AcrR family transcriptional regulator [Bifidobacterium commune]SCC80665.1 transcriptional regulator, TetR family [Bifidobacterium commune]